VAHNRGGSHGRFPNLQREQSRQHLLGGQLHAAGDDGGWPRFANLPRRPLVLLLAFGHPMLQGARRNHLAQHRATVAIVRHGVNLTEPDGTVNEGAIGIRQCHRRGRLEVFNVGGWNQPRSRFNGVTLSGATFPEGDS
jgi:hypothetical protein